MPDLLCPHCSYPLINRGDLPTFRIDEVATGNRKIPVVLMLVCGDCKKVIACLSYDERKPPRRL
jgi:hypothetical protein